MSIKADLHTLITRLEEVVSPVLILAGLPDFDEYLSRNPKRDNDRELCIYVDNKVYDTQNESESFILQVQLYRVTDTEQASEYLDIIYDAIINELKPELIGYNILDSVEANQYPMQKETATVFLIFNIAYIKLLDDCDY